jgi:hypothetical protein
MSDARGPRRDHMITGFRLNDRNLRCPPSPQREAVIGMGRISAWLVRRIQLSERSLRSFTKSMPSLILDQVFSNRGTVRRLARKPAPTRALSVSS